ncbi:MAG: CHAD domain-containing protein, partial [Pseudomonadota bacterium]
MPTLGRARDWDVFCIWLAGEAKRAGEARTDLRAVLARARQRRSAARRAARELVASWRFQRLLLRALRWLTEAPWAGRAAAREVPLAELARASLGRLHRKTVRHGHGIDWEDVERRHALRVKVKRLRYASGFFAPSFARAATRPYLRRLQGLQEILGELNDVAVARRLLAAVVPRAPAPGHRAGTPLRRALAAREAALIASLEPAWHAFRKRRPFWEEARRARG